MIFLGIDYGTKRIGVAKSDPSGTLATPFETLSSKNDPFLDSKLIIKKLTELASKSNIDGVVCSPSDIKLIREIDKTLLFVTPGIRLNTTKDDHSEVFTPRDAIKLGSNYIVIGRPLTEAKNPMQILHNIIDKIEQIS